MSSHCREHGLDLWLRYLQSYYARTELDRGRWSEAVAAIPARLDTAGTPLARITGLLVLGLVRARRGDPGQWEVLDEAHRLAAASGELQWIAPVTAARAEASWLAGLDGSTTVPPRALMEQCVGAGARWWAGELAWWRRRSGIDEPAPPCAVPWALQLAGDAETAAAAWHELGCPYEEALAWASGRDHDHLRRAFDLLDSLGAGAAADVVARRMRELGVRVVPRGVRSTTRANPAGLTSRELEVLVLVADGLRNTQIADRLVLSKKTVDHHVSSILAKLGVSSRAAAAAEARTFGFLDQR